MASLLQNFRKMISSEAISVAKDVLEMSLDKVLENETLKEIPFFGWVISFYKIGTSIRERHTIKKVAAFLNALHDISEEEKQAFESRLKDEDKKEELFETILITLDRLDDTLKAEMVGNLFLMYIKHAIKKHEFLRFSNIVSKAFVGDLINLHLTYSGLFAGDGVIDERFKEWRDYNRAEFEQNLFSLGLMQQTIGQKASNAAEANGIRGVTEPFIKTDINSLGRSLATFLFYDLNDPYVNEYIEMIKEENT